MEPKPAYERKWHKMENKVNFYRGDEGLVMNFIHDFARDDLQESDEVFFAFTYPFSFEDSETLIENIEEKLKAGIDGIYFKKETLVYSREGRPVRMLTITGKNKMLESREDRVPEEHRFDDENTSVLHPDNDERAF